MRVTTIGVPILDLFLTGEFSVVDNEHFTFAAGFPLHRGICFPLGEKIRATELRYALGGGVLNTAETFAQLGLATTACGKLANDPLSAQVRTLLRGKAYTRALRRYRGLTNLSTILLTPSGERTILTYRDSNTRWQLSELPLPREQLVYLAMGHSTPLLWKRYLPLLRRRKNLIAANPSPLLLTQRHLAKNILNALDVLILNHEEAELFLRREGQPEEILVALRAALPQPRVMAMTLGADGVLVDAKKKSCHEGGSATSGASSIFQSTGFCSRRAIDVTGAGDAFASAFVGSLALDNCAFSEITIREAIRKGCANAVSVIEQIGAQAGILTKQGYRALRFRRLSVTVK